MMDQLLHVGLSNVCVSLGLALVALVVEKILKRPRVAYLLWLLVFVKLLTPPLVTVPVITLSGSPSSTNVAIEIPSGESAKDAYFFADAWFTVLAYGKKGLSLLWIPGSVFVLIVSLARVNRFNRLLGIESRVAPQALQTMAAKIAGRLGLGTLPTIYTTSAHFSPMVWWIGGRVRIVIPAILLDQMKTGQLQWILAHELAHVCRRDYLVRWIEWLTVVCFWWNPVVWLARYHLRANEEICCDTLVLSSLKPQPHEYAHSLLTAVEYLTFPARRPPALASQINSFGLLKKRLQMIVSENASRSNPRWLRACVLLFAVLMLPLGVTYAVTEAELKTEEMNPLKNELKAKERERLEIQLRIKEKERLEIQLKDAESRKEKKDKY